MIKNRTLEFKQKYSTSEPKQHPPRNPTPEYVKNKFTTTGFTDFSVSTSAKLKSTRKLAKVQSTAFMNSRKKLSQFCVQAETQSRKYIDNSTSLCQYLQSANKKMEKPPINRDRMNLNEETMSQNATSESHKFAGKEKINQPKNQIVIRELPDINAFFNSLTPRSLFFCCKCFRYVFAIEKNLHYPKCENEVNLMQIHEKEKQTLAWQRLQMMLELSQYTNFKHTQISLMYKNLKDKKFLSFQNIVVSPNVTYLGFQSIIEAFAFTYELMLKRYNTNSSGIFNMKKLFSCVQPKQSQTLFEKRLFQ